MAKTARPRKAATATDAVNAWEDDPGSGVLDVRPIPDPARKPLAFTFPKPAPKPARYEKGTPQFRYWTAAEALRRGADFWAARVPLAKWEPGTSLKVLLDEGTDLNAFYDRKALNFFHGPSPSGTVFSGESPDIVCHEMGHAILDAFKPELWGAASHETAAFHESFADISAILSAIQLQSVRVDVLNATGGHLYRNSRLSRLAEQLGAAIRAQQPDAVDPDCLRNAVNSFTYRDPTMLPSSAPAAQLSSEPHSFSRLFTGAFFEALGSALTAKAANPGTPTEKELLAVANDLAGILVSGIREAPVVSNWYAQVAADMVLAAGTVDPKYPPILKAVFVRRSILSLHVATTLKIVPQAMAAVAPRGAAPTAGLSTIALPASHYGIDGLLFVEQAAQPRRFVAMSAATDSSSIDPSSGASAAQAFVDDLFRRGRVEYGDVVPAAARLDHGRRLKSHRLTRVAGGARLERLIFDCGLCRD